MFYFYLADKKQAVTIKIDNKKSLQRGNSNRVSGYEMESDFQKEKGKSLKWRTSNRLHYFKCLTGNRRTCYCRLYIFLKL